MSIFDLYSKRQKDAAKSGKADVYQYETIPPKLRTQIKQISLDAIGLVGVTGGYMDPDEDNEVWFELERIYKRENGLESIARGDFAGARILAFMRECGTEDWLDLLELIVVGIDLMGRGNFGYERQKWQVKTNAEDAIEEINYRLREAQVGFQVEDRRLVRVDSQFLHSEVVKPALALLSRKGFEGPRQEFLAAHQHYRAGKNREAVAMAANALESTLKAICDQRGWSYDKGSRISDLIKVAKSNGLWPDYLDNSFDQLIATLRSGLPKLRDNDAAHGQGSVPKKVPEYVAAYALHLAASKIVFLAEAARL